MAEPPVTPYDEIPYPGQVHAQTHPDRLAVVAALRGLAAAPPGACRVLELGCGDGSNLLSMAQHAPESEFVGVDLAPTAVEQGRRTARALGWDRVKLRTGDITKLDGDLGTFDYVVAHGVYSWVPAPVRDAILSTAAAVLRPNGVAFVSYICYPGAHLGQMLREMMLLHLREEPDGRQRIARSLEFLRFLAGTRQESDPWRQCVTRELERALERKGSVLRHDELGDVRDPVWFHEFAAHAARHGLAFLGEADWFESSDLGVGAESRPTIQELERDPLAREQYLDFAKCRRFRQTLLCRAGTPLAKEPQRAAVRTLHVSGNLKNEATPVPAGAVPPGPPDLSATSPERFVNSSGGAVETDAPVVRAALRLLGGAWPRRLRFDELFSRARLLLSASGASLQPEAADADVLAEMTYRLYETGVLRLHAHAAPCAAEPGERPCVGALARAQVQAREVVVSLVHENVTLADETSRGLVRLMDGTRDRAKLAADLQEHVQRFSPPGAESPPVEAAQLETALRSFAKLGLLTA